MGIISIIKPNKLKIFGTILVIVLLWFAGFLESSIVFFTLGSEVMESIQPEIEATMESITEGLPMGKLISLRVIGYIIDVLVVYLAVSIILSWKKKKPETSVK